MSSSEHQGWPDEAQIEADLQVELGIKPQKQQLESRLIKEYLTHILAALHEIRDNPKKPKN